MLFSLQKEHTYIITLKVKFILSTNDDKNAAVPLLLIMVVVMTMIMMMMRTIMGDGGGDGDGGVYNGVNVRCLVFR